MYLFPLVLTAAGAWHTGPRLLPSLHVVHQSLSGRAGVTTTLSWAYLSPAASTGTPIASCNFTDSIQEDGWSRLVCSTSPLFSDEQQAYAAGYLEGLTTSGKIYEGIVNTGANFSWPPPLARFLEENDLFMRRSIVAEAPSPYWHQVSLVLTQLDGLQYGFADAAKPPGQPWVPPRALYNVQLGGDMEDLSAALNLSTSPRRAARAAARRAALGAAFASEGDEGGGHCSALVRLLGDSSDVLFGQVTWAGFEDMTRILKTYSFPYSTTGEAGAPRVPAESVVFSSDPASLFSGDDFYLMHPTRLAMLETTIGNNNMTLYSLFVKPDTVVLEWVRNVVANRLAASGPEWAEVFSLHNSGTYNNENLIADFKLFSPGSPPGENFLTGLDQIPGSCETHDLTPELIANGYVGSYNVARFPATYNASGMVPLWERFGDWFSFENTARANIFRRDAPKVASEAEFAALLRYNNFLRDPLSRQGCSGNPPSSAENAISARDDLNPLGGMYPFAALSHRDHAAIDAKLTSASRILRNPLSMSACAGPTYGPLPAFQWSSSFYANLSHLGHPDRWEFTFVEV